MTTAAEHNAAAAGMQGLSRFLGDHPWVSFSVRRLARLAVSMFLLVTAAFAMIHATPGDPVRESLGPLASQQLVTAKRHAAGLDRPILSQYVDYLHSVVTGDLGTSFGTGLPVTDLLTSRLLATAQLAVSAFLIVMLIGLPLGMFAALLTQRGRRPTVDVVFSGVSGFFAVVPEFLLAVVLVFCFALSVRLFPVAGRSGLTSYVLPVLALAIGPSAVLARIARVETVRVLQAEYMRTARAKRLPARLLCVRHALPNLLTASLTLAGLILSGLLAGTVLVENIFAWPGLGTELVASVQSHDYPVVQGLALIFGTGVLLINLTVDVIIALVDPRSTIREG